MLLASFAALSIFHFLLVFCRVGSAVMTMPGFGEIYLSPTIRLLFALLLSLVMLPVASPMLPTIPVSVPGTFLLLGTEILVGLLIGGLGRIIQSALHVAGMIFAFQSSLASAILFDPTQGNQGSVLGVFMIILGITLLFATNLDHVLLTGLANSYHLFTPGKPLPLGDFADSASKAMSESFLVGVQIASPLIVVGLLLYLVAGLMSRLMPNMQVFFILVPVQLVVSFYVMMLTLSAGMMLYLHHMEETYNHLFVH